ncbi:MAG: hypothetical protein IJU70_07830 [Lentisphaeria bacterium]|nr:hypothetical protein [Lentisphaeria bacterium]
MSVEDSGCGISEEDIRRTATPYVQGGADASSRYGGTGLGLAITRDLARAMNGEMTVSSTLGKGTIFSITPRDVETGRLPQKNDGPEVAQTAAFRHGAD